VVGADVAVEVEDPSRASQVVEEGSGGLDLIANRDCNAGPQVLDKRGYGDWSTVRPRRNVCEIELRSRRRPVVRPGARVAAAN